MKNWLFKADILHAIKKRKAVSPQSRGDSLLDERRFIGKVKAML
jgi:hypothetical protein